MPSFLLLRLNALQLQPMFDCVANTDAWVGVHATHRPTNTNTNTDRHQHTTTLPTHRATMPTVMCVVSGERLGENGGPVDRSLL